MSDQDNAVKKLCAVTHMLEEEARHLLEAFDWNYEDAVSSHFEDTLEGTPSHEPLPNITQVNLGNSSENAAEAQKTKQKVTTFDSIRNKDSGNSEEEGQAFYVGGSERGGGGQQVLGPPKKRTDRTSPNPNEAPDKFVQDLFNSAKIQGAEVLNTHQYDEKFSQKPRAKIPFSGTGYKLGGDPTESSPIVGSGGPASASGSLLPTKENTDSQTEQEKHVVVKMWRDGFSWNDGPLRSYDDPNSEAFLEDIKNGRVPEELIRSAHGGLVNVLLEDHHHEEWRAPPAPKVVPFSGKGMMLGHPVPSLASHVSSTKPSQEETPKFSMPTVEVDEAKPVTQLQIRLPDGGRLLVRLNHSHTIADIRQTIVSQRPSLAACPFVLHTTFPNRALQDEQLSLDEAKLLNSALLVRFT